MSSTASIKFLSLILKNMNRKENNRAIVFEGCAKQQYNEGLSISLSVVELSDYSTVSL